MRSSYASQGQTMNKPVVLILVPQPASVAPLPAFAKNGARLCFGRRSSKVRPSVELQRLGAEAVFIKLMSVTTTKSAA
jgi:hypothetical protein